ncbi:MAG: hypothetical protein KGQ59_04235 [Bdellovibrionales bacterium]|nr:hypothetical protein [Bdellovibrionales bacterium]
MNRIRVVLADPRFAANIGHTARVCANFGVTDFHGVSKNPARWFWQEAEKIAVAPADQVLSRFQIHADVTDAVKDCDFAVAFTRRRGEERDPDLTPGGLAQLLLKTSPKKIALVFGNEETGLTEAEIRPCAHVCFIPTSPSMSSMNLSHAVSVTLGRLYEDLHFQGFWATEDQNSALERAPVAELTGLFQHWRELLLASGLTQGGNPERLLRRLERIFHRSRLSSREVKIFRGILSKTLNRMS